MANRRSLKKEISYVAGDLFMEVLVCKLYIPGVDAEKADVLMARILDMQEEYICRVSHAAGKEKKGCVKEYFQKLRADLQVEINAIAAEVGELNK